jgi:hypothetical protein
MKEFYFEWVSKTMKLLGCGIILERIAQHMFRPFFLVFCEVAHICLWNFVEKSFVMKGNSSHETLLEGGPHSFQLIQDVSFINVKRFLEEFLTKLLIKSIIPEEVALDQFYVFQ